MDERTLQLATYLLFVEWELATLPASAPALYWHQLQHASVCKQDALCVLMTPAARRLFYSLCP